MLKWDLIYIVPSTITDNYVGFEMELWLKNICAYVLRQLKIMPEDFFFFLISQTLLKSKNPVNQN